MKKSYWISMCLIFLLFLSSCSSKQENTPQNTWRDDFSVQCKHIEESVFDDPWDELDAVLGGYYVYEQDEYAITNKTNYVLRFVKLYFSADIPGYEPFEFYKYVGIMKQGETETISITKTLVKIEMEELGLISITDDLPDYFDFEDIQLSRIEYEKSE